jgi:DNA mismatch repair protein MutL
LIKLALSHPEITFKLINNQKLVLSTSGNCQLQDTLSSLYGHKIIPDILPVTYSSDDITISGYLGKPTLLKSSRHWQTFIVNARIINSRFIAKALDNAYHSLLPKSGYPLAVLNITVPADSIDVNVHPQKSEIKFSDDKKVFRAIYKAISEVLTAQHSPSQLAATVQPKFTEFPNSYQATTLYHNQPNQPNSSFSQSVASWREESLPLSTVNNMFKQEDIIGNTANSQSSTSSESAFTLYPLGQIDCCYIIAQGSDGLYIIDQHAAHERILYDSMSKATDRIPSQQLLIPLFFEFDTTESNTIIEYLDVFYQMGFTLELVGPNMIRLLELPADFPVAEAEALIRRILGSIQNLQTPTPQELRHACLQTAACHAAIKAGESLNMRQIQALISELCTTALPYTCPHGRPAIIRFSPADLAKMFKRS